MGALMRYQPVSSLSRMIDELFDESTFFNALDRAVPESNWPRVDITEDEKAYHIKADLPGMDKDDISVTVEKGRLTISGEKKEEKKEKKKGQFYHYERRYGSFSRSFNLPDHVDAAHIDAAYRNGVLDLTLKKTEGSKPKAIEVKVK
ncbi:MAG: Hsp20/alpha crystallin family protein [Chitinispirillaceae bacterium]